MYAFSKEEKKKYIVAMQLISESLFDSMMADSVLHP